MWKRMGRSISVLLIVLLSFTLVPGVSAAQPAAPEAAMAGDLKIDGKSAALIDLGSGKLLYEQNSHESLPPASVTKVMTMLLAMEAVDRGQIAMDDAVTISQRAASMGGSQMFMEAGETQTVETLLKGMAICSANDACKKHHNMKELK